MEELTVHVTLEDIARGKRGHGRKCPIALALKRASSDQTSLATWDYLATSHFRIKSPREVQGFMNRFDQGACVEPFSFVLRLI